MAYVQYSYHPPLSWWRYALSGGEWRVCPARRDQIAAHDAQELAQDSRDLLDRRIIGAIVFVCLLAVIGYALAQDLSVFSAPLQSPRPTSPSILAPR